jgi:hypothetical protein
MKLVLDFAANDLCQHGVKVPSHNALGTRPKQQSAMHGSELTSVLEHREAESDDSFVGLAGRQFRSGLRELHPSIQILQSALKHVILISEVHVKG